MERRNVHEFDGRLCQEAMEEMNQRIQAATPSSDKVDLKDQLHDLRARSMFRELQVREDPKNWDPTNQIHATDLLRLLLYKIETLQVEEDKKEWIQMLEEQLLDMVHLGPCPQGRTIRLWQLYQSLS